MLKSVFDWCKRHIVIFTIISVVFVVVFGFINIQILHMTSSSATFAIRPRVSAPWLKWIPGNIRLTVTPAFPVWTVTAGPVSWAMPKPKSAG